MNHYKDNYCGPLGETFFLLFKQESNIAHVSKGCIENVLSVDGDFLPEFQVVNPIFLTIAKYIIHQHEHLLLDDCSFETKVIYQILRLRTFFHHQRSLSSFSPKLREQILSVCNSLTDSITSSTSLGAFEIILILFEIISALLYYRLESLSRNALDLVSKYSGISVSWTGVSGRRLIHQKEKISLLSIIISKERQQGNVLPMLYENENQNIPKVIPLSAIGDQDKYLELDDIDELDAVHSRQSYFDVFIENAFLLSNFYLLLISVPDSPIRNEQLSTLANSIITNSVKSESSKSTINWSVFSTALSVRSVWVENKGLKAVRSCLQLEALISQISSPLQEDESVSQRLCLCWCIPGLFSAVDLKRSYGRLLAQLGAPLSAYEVYYKLGDMPLAIKALVSASQYDQAISSLLDLLKKDISLSNRLPLLCLLGDLKDGDVSLYEEAWELSNHRYAAAKRSLGFTYQKKGHFHLAIDAFKISLKISPLFASVWFYLGCCYIKVNDYDGALMAFRRSLAMSDYSDFDDGAVGTSPSDIWSNISLTHNLQGNISEAFSAIQEATRGRYEDYRTWENYLHLALQFGKDPLQVLLAIGRLNEIRAGSVNWNIFDMVWNTLRPISCDETGKCCLKFMTWIEEAEPDFGNEASYWRRRALMISRLSSLASEAEYHLKASEWECWLKAYQISSSSTTYSVLPQVEAIVALLQDMSNCAELNIPQFSSILRTASSRIKKLYSPHDACVVQILADLEKIALTLDIAL